VILEPGEENHCKIHPSKKILKNLPFIHRINARVSNGEK
jgi:hypothetical protein